MSQITFALESMDQISLKSTTKQLWPLQLDDTPCIYACLTLTTPSDLIRYPWLQQPSLCEQSMIQQQTHTCVAIV